MAARITSWRTLRLALRHSTKVERTCLRTLTTQWQKDVPRDHVHCHVAQLQLIRRIHEWAPNIIRSHYPEFEIPSQFFHDFFWSRYEKWADLLAVVCGLTGREMTYRELRRQCRQVATALLQEGLRPGQVVALVLPNTPVFPVLALGVLEAGLVLSPINPAYTPDEIAYQMKNSSSVAVFTIPDKLNDVLEAKAKITSENEKLGSNIRVISTPDVFGKEHAVPGGVESYSKYVGDHIDHSLLPSLQTRDRTQNDVVFMPYSSGTTGHPKGVCLTHVNLIAALLNTLHTKDIEETSNGKQEVVPCVLPGFHIYGFSIVMGVTLLKGGKLVMLPKFEESTFLKVMLDYKPTVLYVAPPLVLYLGASPSVTKEHLKTLKLIVSGAAPCTHDDIKKCVDKSPPNTIYKQGYGLTETSPAVCLTVDSVKKYSSVGPPVRNTAVKVADLQTGQPLGPNEEGEICVKGPQVMSGYLNNPEANAEVFDGEGWFHTGDIGYYDDDKHFYITDRRKELIKVKGFQVAPAELEGLLRSHPSVEDAGVIGVPDQRKGEAPVGFIKPKKGATVSVNDLKDFLSQKIAKYKQIDTYFIVDSIPKSASGKILRRKLKETFLQNVNLENYMKEKQS